MDKHVLIEINGDTKPAVILEEILDGKTLKYRVRLDEGKELIVNKERVSKYIIDTNYETDLNGRKIDFSETPLQRKSVTYYNPLTGKWQNQNYVELDNIIVSPMLRINEKTGKVEFALEHKLNAAMMKNENYNGQVWETPVFSITEDVKLSKEEVERILEEQCMSKYGEEYLGSRKLEDTPTPISQSFTHQLALFRIVLVYYNKDSELNWYPIDSLQDFMEENRKSPFTSLQTAYAFEMLQSTYGKKIGDGKSKFDVNRNFQPNTNNIETREVLPKRKIIRYRKY